MIMRTHLVFLLLLFFPVTLFPALVFSQEDQLCACKNLSKEKNEFVTKILQAQYPYDCCDQTLAECLMENHRCRVAVRLARQICTMAAQDGSVEMIEDSLAKRAATMLPSPSSAKVDMTRVALAGDKASPVTLVAYLCVRCPFCSKLLPKLYKEVTEGQLKGKVKLAVRLFPIKGHKGSVDAGLAALAAQKQGKFFQFMLYAYEHFDDFSPEKLAVWTKDTGLDMTLYEAAVNDPATRLELVAGKKEGVANQVGATPTLFINGRLYRASMTQLILTDILEEEFERVTGNIRE